MAHDAAGAAAPAAGDEQPHLTRRQILVVMAGVMSGMLLAALDQSIVGTALPTITSELGGLDKLSWVVTAYLLTATAMTPLWGKLSDLYGRRPAFQAAIGIFLVGSALCGAAQDIYQLIGFRALQGIGGGGLFAIALSIVGDVVPPRERGRYGGYFGAVFGVSSVAGPLLGGFFTDGPGWRWIFYVNVPVGGAALVITSVALAGARTSRQRHAIDWLGALLVVGTVTSLLLYLEWRGRDYGWADPGALVLLGGAVLLAVLFVVVERRAAEPILPLALFRGRVFTGGALFTFLGGAALFGGIIYLPVYFQTVQQMSATRSGLAMLPVVLGILVASVVCGRLLDRTGRYKPFPVLGAVLLIVAFGLLTQVGVDTPYVLVAGALLLLGVGLGCQAQTVITAVQASVRPADIGAATGSVTFFRQLGGSVGTAVFGAVLASRLATHLAEELASAPGGAAAAGAVDPNDVAAIRALPEPVRDRVLAAFASAMDDVFLAAVPLLVVALVVALLLPDVRIQASGALTAPDDPGTGGPPAGGPPAVDPSGTPEAAPSAAARPGGPRPGAPG